MHAEQVRFEQMARPLLERFSGEAGLSVRTADGSFCWGWQDKRLFPTASTVKVFVLGAVLEACEKGRISLHDRIELREADKTGGSGVLCELEAGLVMTVQDAAVLMIVLSDNTATNLMIDLAGGVDAVCHHMKRCGVTSSVLNRKLSEDPAVMNECNLAEACCRDFTEYLQAVYEGRVLTAEYTALFFSIMERQQYKNFLSGMLPLVEDQEEFGIPEEKCVRVACKTGWMPGIRCDVGCLEIGGRICFYAGMTEGSRRYEADGQHEAVRLLGRIGRILYETCI